MARTTDQIAELRQELDRLAREIETLVSLSDHVHTRVEQLYQLHAMYAEFHQQEQQLKEE